VSEPAELERYWRESSSWDADRLAAARRGARLAGWGAGCGWLCAGLCATALALLVPLKQVAPFVIRVDNTTGIVDVVPAGIGRGTQSEIVTRYLLTHYVTVCERFNLATAESDYEECGALQSAQRNQAWYALWNPTNASSPLNLYKDGTTVRASVVSVSFFRRTNGLNDLAQVRYVRRLRRSGATQEEVSHWIATAQYAFTQPSQDLRMRSWNPLGFKIVDFRPEPEVLTPADASASGSLASTERGQAR
jgi:type IV secretion system protein VirB8